MAFWTLRLYHKQTLKCATITAEVNQKETKNGYVCANAGDSHDAYHALELIGGLW